ncbi:MAG: glycosyltransferase family 4 protein [Acidobacteria bacterium]|nr:glycosyltransferase family 4 protein [Acidobacteriota bacterium]
MTRIPLHQPSDCASPMTTGDFTEPRRMTHIWAPDLVSTTGGIQAFCGHFIKALQSYIPADGARLLIKNDRPDDCAHFAAPYPVNACGHWRSPWRTPRFAWECYRQASREQPQLIIAMHLHFAPLAHLLEQRLGVPYVLMAYGIEAWQNQSRLRRNAWQQAALVLAISRYTRNWLIEEGGLQAEQVQLLTPTFSPEPFSIQAKPARLLQKHGLTAQTPVILTVCRLADGEQYKGYDRIIKGLPQMLRELPNTRYILVGAGPDRPRIEKLAQEMGVHDAVIFAGFVANHELADYYNLCDVFAMPSKAEGFGIVFLEALACGKPVLAGNQDGSRDALADGELGVLVDPDDTAEIAAQLLRLLRREPSQASLFRPEFLRQRTIELFGFAAFQRRLIERLENLLPLHERPLTKA